jgi:hypothetical protein
MMKTYPYISPCLHYKLSCFKQSLALVKWKKILKQNEHLRGKYSGKRCFILGTAPSIMDFDLKKISNENIIAINEIHHHPNFDRIFHQHPENKFILLPPSHASANDSEIISSLREMEQKVSPDITHLFGIDGFSPNYYQLIKQYNLFQKHKVYFYRTAVQTQLGWYSFSEDHWDICGNIWSSSVGSVYALIAALYMNFKEVYLIGIDHSYLSFNDHSSYRFYDAKSDSFKKVNEEIERNQQIRKKSQNTIILEGTHLAFEQYALMAQHAKQEIYNLSPQSIIDIFPRKTFDEVVN